MLTRPVISFVLIAYNQEPYIAEAVRGAFAQTYSPLEILLSDDCSSDGTFAVMCEMVAKYHGPHKIVLNQNRTNLGLNAHLNKLCMEVAKGDIVILAAGDDVSFPQRTRQVVEMWQAKGCPSAVGSKYQEIDANGAIIPREYAFNWEEHLLKCQKLENVSRCERVLRFLENGGHSYVRGCAAAWAVNLFQKFGPLPSNAFGEDAILAMRALLSDGEAWVGEELVFYRRHGSNLSTFFQTDQIGSYKTSVMLEIRALQRWRKHGSLAYLLQQEVKTAHILKFVTLEEVTKINAVLDQMIKFETAVLSWFDMGIIKRVTVLPALIKMKGLMPALAWAGVRLFPLKVSCWIRCFIRKAEHGLRRFTCIVYKQLCYSPSKPCDGTRM